MLTLYYKFILILLFLQVIYDYSRCEQLPLFRNLSILRVEFYGYKWEMLPIFLESCPNLKTLVVVRIVTIVYLNNVIPLLWSKL